MAFPLNLQREVEAIQAVNQQADSICKVQHGFAQHHQALTPASMLVHPSNSSMLSFHDVWSKGKQLLHVGMKRQLLEAPFAVNSARTLPEETSSSRRTSRWSKMPKDV